MSDVGCDLLRLASMALVAQGFETMGQNLQRIGIVEDAALTWFGELGYAGAHGPHLAPGEPATGHGGTTCWPGVCEIDPAVALALAGEAGLGPEGANALLVGGSGLSGLVGHRVRLDHVLASKRSDCVRARDVLLYRMLLASSTAAAALGGVDAVVFSGRYASCSAVVAQHVLPHLDRAGALGPHAAEWTIFAKPLEAVLADTAIAN